MKPLDKNPRAGVPAAPAKNGATERAFLDADAWLEHLEEEMEPSCSEDAKADLDLLLKNSSDDAEIVASLKRVRAAVATLSDDVALPESGHYYDALHSKIMAAIDDDIAINGEPARTKKPAAKRRPVLLSSMMGALGMTMMIALLAFVGLRQRAASVQQMAQLDAHREQVIEENFERKIAMVDPHSGATFARDMGSFESEEDFLTETAVARMQQVSSKQADAMIRKLSL